jgi:hypothetical protein
MQVFSEKIFIYLKKLGQGDFGLMSRIEANLMKRQIRSCFIKEIFFILWHQTEGENHAAILSRGGRRHLLASKRCAVDRVHCPSAWNGSKR